MKTSVVMMVRIIPKSDVNLYFFHYRLMALQEQNYLFLKKRTKNISCSGRVFVFTIEMELLIRGGGRREENQNKLYKTSRNFQFRTFFISGLRE